MFLQCENIGVSEAQNHHKEGLAHIDPSIVGVQGSPSRPISKNKLSKGLRAGDLTRPVGQRPGEFSTLFTLIISSAIPSKSKLI